MNMDMMDNSRIKKTSYKEEEYTVYNFLGLPRHIRIYEGLGVFYRLTVNMTASEVQERVTVSENYEAAAAFIKQRVSIQIQFYSMKQYIESERYTKAEKVGRRIGKTLSKLLELQEELRSE